MANSADEFSPELLKIYYERFFPYDEMCQWLSYGQDPESRDPFVDKKYFPNREWSFTIEGDIYIRYQSFNSFKMMKEMIKERQPHKIDIGAIYSHKPSEHLLVSQDKFTADERELIFDIDMTDYDEIRRCCTGANICLRCWPFMTQAIKALHTSLTEDFGFKNILWVYSGRRGIHCWVCDPLARTLKNEARSAIVDYLTVKDDYKLFVNSHPMIEKVYNKLESGFERYMASSDGQNVFAAENWEETLKDLPKSVLGDVAKYWNERKLYKSEERWKGLCDLLENYSKRAKMSDDTFFMGKAYLKQLVFRFCYPRLDINVSKARNHLLKSPFCIHPKTGRVCVPINPKTADDFNPFEVPTVRSLLDEFDQYHRDHPHDSMNHEDLSLTAGKLDSSDILFTSMKSLLDIFKLCFLDGMNAVNRKQLQDRREQTMDF